MSPSANPSPTLPAPGLPTPGLPAPGLLTPGLSAPDPSLPAPPAPPSPALPSIQLPGGPAAMPSMPTPQPAPMATSTPIIAPEAPPFAPTHSPAVAAAPTLTPGRTLDGELPRLGMTSAAPAPARVFEAPDFSHLDLPTLPTVVAVPEIHDEPEVEETIGADSSGEPAHPMAHLMPAKSAPSEAKRRAEEIRAAKKAKTKKIKLAVAAVVVVLAVGVGPFVYKFISNGLNDAGKTTTEEPTG
jgi:hypothetical protein